MEAFGEKHDLKIGTIADLIAYRAMHEQSVELKDRKNIHTEFGEFELFTFLDLVEDELHYALVMGDVSEDEPVLVRVQALNLLRDVLGTQLPDEKPGWSYRRAMQRIAEEGKGVMVLIGQEESAEQLMEEVLQFPNVAPTVSAAGEDGTRIYRLIGTGSQILKQLGISKMRALSAPTRFNAISGFHLEVTEFVEA